MPVCRGNFCTGKKIRNRPCSEAPSLQDVVFEYALFVFFAALCDFFLIITDLGEPYEYALTITENHRGGTENHRVIMWWPSLWPSVALCGPLWLSVVFKGMLF